MKTMGAILGLAVVTRAKKVVACTFCATELSQQVRNDVLTTFRSNLSIAVAPFAVIAMLMWAGYALSKRALTEE